MLADLPCRSDISHHPILDPMSQAKRPRDLPGTAQPGRRNSWKQVVLDVIVRPRGIGFSQPGSAHVPRSFDLSPKGGAGRLGIVRMATNMIERENTGEIDADQ